MSLLSGLLPIAGAVLGYNLNNSWMGISEDTNPWLKAVIGGAAGSFLGSIIDKPNYGDATKGIQDLLNNQANDQKARSDFQAALPYKTDSEVASIMIDPSAPDWQKTQAGYETQRRKDNAARQTEMTASQNTAATQSQRDQTDRQKLIDTLDSITAQGNTAAQNYADSTSLNALQKQVSDYGTPLAQSRIDQFVHDMEEQRKAQNQQLIQEGRGVSSARTNADDNLNYLIAQGKANIMADERTRAENYITQAAGLRKSALDEINQALAAAMDSAAKGYSTGNLSDAIANANTRYNTGLAEAYRQYTAQRTAPGDPYASSLNSQRLNLSSQNANTSYLADTLNNNATAKMSLGALQLLAPGIKGAAKKPAADQTMTQPGVASNKTNSSAPPNNDNQDWLNFGFDEG